ncbi:MAG: helix-turn-helix transcriptional regulator [Thalassobaculales bacterium]
MADRRQIARNFRERLIQVIARSGASQAAYARSIGLDRSTLAQLLAEPADRLPRAETLAAIAERSRVSVDWLLGLSQREQRGADVFGDIMQIAQPEPAPIDDRMFAWMTEAAGYKIRTVTAGVPDVLKTEAAIRCEYPADPERTLAAARSRLDYLRRPETEIEVCCGAQTIAALLRGEGPWAALPAADRAAQAAHIVALTRDLYPSLRVHLFDQYRVFSVPFTVFGQMRVAVYLGRFYFVFTSSEHIRVLTRRFDELVRAAVVQPHDLPGHVEALAAG